MPAHWNKREAAENFRKHWKDKHEELLIICNEDWHQMRFATINDLHTLDTDDLIQWFINWHSWDEENQQWKIYDSTSQPRIDRSDIYYDICKWIQ